MSLDLDEISLDLLDKSPKYENLKSESGKFLLEILSTSVGSGFFGF